MIAQFADLCTYVYVIVDELYQAVAAPHDHRPGPAAELSDSEVITLSLVAELVEMDKESRFLAYVRRHHLALFPRLPERSRYNRRRRALTEVTNRIRGALMQLVLARLTPEERDVCVIDSLPVPVVGFHQARGRHRWYGEASYGYVASKKLTIFGYKLHVLLTHSGLILDFALAPAHHADGTFTEQLLLDKHWLTVLGDKAYLHAALQELLAWRNDLVLLTPKRANQREQLPASLTRALNHFRQAIETINSQLTEQFQIERNRAKSVSGLCARIQAKLTAHTLGLYLNCLLGRPLLALQDLAVI
jgi:DDE family transposase